jgi:hypothetical protein
MADVLCASKEVQMLNACTAERQSVTLSYDERPGIQALAGIAADLAPLPQVYSTVAREYECKRLATVSLLAGLDLHTGHFFPFAIQPCSASVAAGNPILEVTRHGLDEGPISLPA